MTVWVVTVGFFVLCFFVAHGSVKDVFTARFQRGSELRRDTRNVLGVIPDEGFAAGDSCGELCLSAVTSREWVDGEGKISGAVKDVPGTDVIYLPLKFFPNPYGTLLTITEQGYGAVCTIVVPVSPIPGDVVRCVLSCETWEGDMVEETVFLPAEEWFTLAKANHR